MIWRAIGMGAALVVVGGKQLTPGGAAPSDRVQRIAQAIARAEGYGVVAAIPTVRNNPGNIRDNSLPGSPIATYPSAAAGWAALYAQVSKMLAGSSLYPRGWTLEQVAQRYTGEAAYMNWARNVARFLNVPTSIVFSEIP
jgi:hypothetical protein